MCATFDSEGRASLRRSRRAGESEEDIVLIVFGDDVRTRKTDSDVTIGSEVGGGEGEEMRGREEDSRTILEWRIRKESHNICRDERGG